MSKSDCMKMVQAEDLSKLAEPQLPHASEKQTLLSKYDIPVQHLEFSYIEKCNNGKELERILHVLKSGEEGYYPQLLEFAEKRLTEVKPKSKYLQKVTPVLSKEQMGKSEWNTISKDLTEWMEDVSLRDHELEARKTKEPETEVEIRKSTGIFKEPSGKLNPKRISSTDYESWDKYDPDTEILKMELEEEKLKKEATNSRKKQSKQCKTVSFTSNFATEAEATYQATCEKERGNEYFKAGEHTNALEHYTNSLRCKPLTATYTNRALVHNKLGMHTKAIDDCTAALKLEPNNFKAYLRMAEAHESLKRYDEAWVSVESAIRVDPNNLFAQQLANRIRPKITDVNNPCRRFTIEDTEEVKPKTILKKQEKFGETSSKTKAVNRPRTEKSQSHEVIPIPGSSKMLPPFYRIVSSKDPDVVGIERKKILNRPHLLHLTTIDVDSEEEDYCMVKIYTPSKKSCKEKENKIQKRAAVCKNKTKDVTKIKNKRRLTTVVKTEAIHFENTKECSGEPQNRNENGIRINSEELRSSYGFIQVWNSVKKDKTLAQQADVLKKLDFERVDEVIGYKLDDEMLTTFINCLCKHFMFPSELDTIRSILTNILRVPRFQMISLFLRRADWENVNSLIKFLDQHGRSLPDDVKQFYSSKL